MVALLEQGMRPALFVIELTTVAKTQRCVWMLLQQRDLFLKLV